MFGIHGRWIRVVMSILLSAVLWLSVKLAMRYNTMIDIPVRYQNVPATLKFVKPLPKTLQVAVTGMGHQLLLPSIKLTRDSLPLDIAAALKPGFMKTDELRTHIEDFLPGSLVIENITPDTLALAFEEKIYKTVPLVSMLKIKTAEGYRFTKNVQLVPDSVTLMGTRTELAQVQHWETEPREIAALAENRQVNIRPAPSSQIMVQPQQVAAHLFVDKFTEGSVTLPVHAVNVAAGRSVRLMPATVTIKYLVPFADYTKVDETDFDVEADFSLLEPGAQYVVPKLKRKPTMLQAVHLEPAYLRFVVTTR
jgi:YbbR domain-containing protein